MYNVKLGSKRADLGSIYPIVPVVHSNGSGVTAQFTAFLASQHASIWDARLDARVGNPLADRSFTTDNPTAFGLSSSAPVSLTVPSEALQTIFVSLRSFLHAIFGRLHRDQHHLVRLFAMKSVAIRLPT